MKWKVLLFFLRKIYEEERLCLFSDIFQQYFNILPLIQRWNVIYSRSHGLAVVDIQVVGVGCNQLAELVLNRLT